MPIVEQTGYEPPFLLRNRVMNWLWANMVRRVPHPPYEKFERIIFPKDLTGSFFTLAWWRLEANTPGRRVALIAPGLNGGAYSKPTSGMARALHQEGWDVAVWIFRDTEEQFTSVRSTYSGVGLHDLEVAVDKLRENYEEIALVGLSLGANMILQYVCANPNGPVSRTVSISPPIDLGATVGSWSRGLMGRLIISPSAKRKMAKLTSDKKKATGAVAQDDVDAYETVRLLSEADHYVTCEFNEFPTASHYWYQATTKRGLRTVETQTKVLIVMAKDDFLLESHSYPHADALSPDITLELTKYGSHISFVPRGCRRPRYWSEQRAVDHLNG
jgi:predicted alpha/beta-fold hydrolase